MAERKRRNAFRDALNEHFRRGRVEAAEQYAAGNTRPDDDAARRAAEFTRRLANRERAARNAEEGDDQ